MARSLSLNLLASTQAFQLGLCSMHMGRYPYAHIHAYTEELGEKLEHLGGSPISLALTLVIFSRHSVAGPRFSCGQRQAFHKQHWCPAFLFFSIPIVSQGGSQLDREQNYYIPLSTSQ